MYTSAAEEEEDEEDVLSDADIDKYLFKSIQLEPRSENSNDTRQRKLLYVLLQHNWEYYCDDVSSRSAKRARGNEKMFTKVSSIAAQKFGQYIIKAIPSIREDIYNELLETIREDFSASAISKLLSQMTTLNRSHVKTLGRLSKLKLFASVYKIIWNWGQSTN
jgi:hypothetical protein